MLKGFSSRCFALQPVVRLQMCTDAKAIFPFGQFSESDLFSFFFFFAQEANHFLYVETHVLGSAILFERLQYS